MSNRVIRGGLLSGCTAALLAPLALGAGDREVADWSDAIWSAASSHRSEKALALLHNPPQELGDAGLAGMSDRISLALDNAKTWEDKRQARMSELRDELASPDSTAEGLRTINEMMELEDSREAVLKQPGVITLVDKARREATVAEREQRWLDALELYSRLSLIYDIEGTYDEDVTRMAQRLQMLRLYTPEFLHGLQDAQRQARGEDPLPPFNAMGEDWRVKLSGIERDMVTRPLWIASKSQVDGIDLSEMLLGGISAVRTMVTTNDLAQTFPGLRNPDGVDEYLDFLDETAGAIRENPRAIGISKMFDMVRTVTQLGQATVNLPEEAVLHEFGNGAMGKLDEYSTIIWPNELKQFKRSIEGKFTGVGIQITLNDSKVLEVVTPLQGTPASRAGIRSGDRIVAVDGQPTLGFTLNQAVDLITGPEGTGVNLEVERDGVTGTLKFRLVRAEIPINSIKGWRRTGPGEMDWDWFVDPDNKIGYVRLSQFSNETTNDLRRALKSMQMRGMKGLILDLRYNPGGLLDEAVKVSNTFLAKDGVIVSQENGSGFTSEVQRARRSGALLPDMPLVVMINEGSASASEIVAGALQDHDRAVLVGQRSFGKGSVQNVFPLINDAAMFKLTTQYYRLPGGRLIHKRPQRADYGVEPNVTVKMLPEQLLESLKLRNDADVMLVDEEGAPIPGVESADPDRLLSEGLDPQLSTALLLVQSKVAADGLVRAAAR